MEAASGKKILIVEDERDVVDLLTLSLRKAGGFVVSTAADGATGLHKARTEKPAFIILDLMLPKMPGLEVCKITPPTSPRTRFTPPTPRTSGIKRTSHPLRPSRRAIRAEIALDFLE